MRRGRPPKNGWRAAEVAERDRKRDLLVQRSQEVAMSRRRANPGALAALLREIEAEMPPEQRVRHDHCARCNSLLPEDNDEADDGLRFCWWCQDPLCAACTWDYGECGHRAVAIRKQANGQKERLDDLIEARAAAGCGEERDLDDAGDLDDDFDAPARTAAGGSRCLACTSRRAAHQEATRVGLDRARRAGVRLGGGPPPPGLNLPAGWRKNPEQVALVERERSRLAVEVVRLRAAGASWAEVAREIGVPKSSVRYLVQHTGGIPRSEAIRAGVARARAAGVRWGRPPVVSGDRLARVLGMIAQGDSVRHAARSLGLASSTVARAVARAASKVDPATRQA